MHVELLGPQIFGKVPLVTFGPANRESIGYILTKCQSMHFVDVLDILAGEEVQIEKEIGYIF